MAKKVVPTLELNTLEEIKDYLVIKGQAFDEMLMHFSKIAQSYILAQTNKTDAEVLADERMLHQFEIAHLVLISEMFSNRSYTVDTITLNPIVKSILDFYSDEYIL